MQYTDGKTVVTTTVDTLYKIYNAGFEHGLNEGVCPEHGTLDAFERLIQGKSPLEDNTFYGIERHIKLEKNDPEQRRAQNVSR